MMKKLKNDPAILHEWQSNAGTLSLTVLSNGRIATGHNDRTIKIWEPSGNCLAVLKGHNRPVTALTALPNGLFASGSLDKSIRLWNQETGHCIRTIFGQCGNWIHTLKFLDNTKIVSESNQNNITLLNLETGQPIFTLTEHSKRVYAFAVLPRERLASGSLDNSIKIWDLNSRTCLSTLAGSDGHTDLIYTLVSLPGDRLASGSYDKTIKIWDLKSNQCVATLRGHSNWVTSLTMLRDNYLVSGSRDHTIQIWDLSSEKRKQVIFAEKPVTEIAVLSDGRLVSVRSGGTITVWNSDWLLQNSTTHLELYAKAGITEAQRLMAKFYIKSKHNPGVNIEQKLAFEQKAFEWYRRAAAGGSTEAQVKVGKYYEKGKGISFDAIKSLDYYYEEAQRRSSYLPNLMKLFQPKIPKRFAYLGPGMWECSEQYLFRALWERQFKKDFLLVQHDLFDLENRYDALQGSYEIKRNFIFWVDYFVTYLIPLKITHLLINGPQLTLEDQFAIQYLQKKYAETCRFTLEIQNVIHSGKYFDPRTSRAALENFFEKILKTEEVKFELFMAQLDFPSIEDFCRQFFDSAHQQRVASSLVYPINLYGTLGTLDSVSAHSVFSEDISLLEGINDFIRLLERNFMTFSPSNTTQDPAVRVVADMVGNDHSYLPEERIYFANILIETFKSFFPEQANQLNVNCALDKTSQKESVLQWMASMITEEKIKKFWCLFKAMIGTSPDSKPILSFLEVVERFFLKLNRLEVLSDWQTLEQELANAELAFKTQLETKYNRKFFSMAEGKIHENCLRLEEKLPKLMFLDIRPLREYFARNSLCSTFNYLATQAVKDKKYDHDAVKILDKLFMDFISQNPRGLWPFRSDNNYGYDIFSSPEETEKLLSKESRQKKYVDSIINQLEYIIDGFNKIDRSVVLDFLRLHFIYSVEEYEDAKKRLEDSLKENFPLIQSLIFYCERKLVELFLQDLSYTDPLFRFSFKSIGYTREHPLVKNIHERYKKLHKSHNDSNLELLKDIHMYPFRIVRKIYELPKTSWKIYKTIEHDQKLKSTLMSVISEQLLSLLRTPLKQGEESFIDVIRELIAQRSKSDGNLNHVLAFGFKGSLSLYNPTNEPKGTIYVSFSHKGRTEWHTYLLKEAIYPFYTTKAYKNKELDISIIDNNGLLEKGIAKDIRLYYQPKVGRELDELLYKRLLRILLEKILLPIKSVDLVHLNIKNAFYKLIPIFFESDREQALFKKGSLTLKEFERIWEKINSKLHMTCAETLISKYGHTNCYIPVMFLSSHKLQVKLKGEPQFSGEKRSIIAPCEQCRILSAPYMFWSILYNGWGLGELSETAKNLGEPPISPLFGKKEHMPTHSRRTFPADTQWENVRSVSPKPYLSLPQPSSSSGLSTTSMPIKT